MWYACQASGRADDEAAAGPFLFCRSARTRHVRHLAGGRSQLPRRRDRQPRARTTSRAPSAIIITRDLAHKLFPGRCGCGQGTFYLTDDWPEHDHRHRRSAGRSPTLAARPVRSTRIRSWCLRVTLNPDGGVVYLVRAQPGQLAAVLRAAPAALIAQNRMRLISPEDGVVTLAQARARGLRHRSRRGDHDEGGLRVAAVGDGRRHRRIEQLLGRPAASIDRRAPRAGCDAWRHPALFPDRERVDCRHRCGAGRGTRHRREPVADDALRIAADAAVGARASGRCCCGCLASWPCYGPARRAAAVPPVEATRSV